MLKAMRAALRERKGNKNQPRKDAFFELLDEANMLLREGKRLFEILPEDMDNLTNSDNHYLTLSKNYHSQFDHHAFFLNSKIRFVLRDYKIDDDTREQHAADFPKIKLARLSNIEEEIEQIRKIVKPQLQREAFFRVFDAARLNINDCRNIDQEMVTEISDQYKPSHFNAVSQASSSTQKKTKDAFKAVVEMDNSRRALLSAMSCIASKFNIESSRNPHNINSGLYTYTDEITRKLERYQAAREAVGAIYYKVELSDDELWNPYGGHG